MAEPRADKEAKIKKAKEYLGNLNSALQEILAENQRQMKAVLKKRDDQKVSDILNELKGM